MLRAPMAAGLLAPAAARAAADRVPVADPPPAAEVSTQIPWRDVADGVAGIPDAVAQAAARWSEWLGAASPHLAAIMAVALAGAVALVACRYLLEPRLYVRGARLWPAHPLAVSLPGLAAVVVQTLVAATGLSVLGQLLTLEAATPFVRGQVTLVVTVSALAVFVAALGRASLRLVSGTPDPVLDAPRLQPVAAWLAGLLVLVAGVERSGFVPMAADGAPSPLAHLLVALLFCTIASLALLRLAAALQVKPDGWGARERRAHHLLRLLLALGWLLLAVVAGSLVLGYAALAAFLAKQGIWSVIVLAFLHLVWRVVRDASDLLLSRQDLMERWSRRLGIDGRRLQQAVIVVGGVLVFMVASLALVLLTAPYGLGPDDMFGRVVGRGGSLAIGGLVISPGQIVRALLLFACVALVARLVARWLACRLLPTTRMDAGVQASLTSIIGYVGVIVGVAMALAALGIGMDRITWVVSALTVGIGFGLQAIVQNFISGLILLAERPVKVGDWVVVGDAEGDVRRINVRATEIALPDRTVVLVPNSELITKVVRNRTFSSGDGLVKILLPLPATADVANAVRLVGEVVNANRDLKSAPAPLVQVEEVRDNKVWLGISGHVDGPRQVTRIRAELLYQLVERLQGEGIALV